MTKGSSRPFAVFDIDGTLIRWQLYHAIVDNLVKLGFIAPAKLKAIKNARMVWKRRESSESYKEYEHQLVKIYEELLAGITVSQFEASAEAVFEEYKDQVYTYTRDLLKKLKKDGYLLFAISGSQTEIISKMADYYGFDDFVARVDKREGDRFSGKSFTPVLGKDKVLRELAAKHGVDFKGSIGVGDSTSDIKMLEQVEAAIAFNPERQLFDTAAERGWKIVIERKNMIYELEKSDGRYILAKTN